MIPLEQRRALDCNGGLEITIQDRYGQVFSEFKIFQVFYISIYNDIYIRYNIYIYISHL